MSVVGLQCFDAVGCAFVVRHIVAFGVTVILEMQFCIIFFAQMIAAAGYLQKIVLQICEATLIPSTVDIGQYLTELLQSHSFHFLTGDNVDAENV